MKASRLIPVVLALTALTAPAAASAQGFEGVIKQQTTMVLPQGVAALAGADAAGTDLLKILQAVAPKIDGADPSVLQKQEMTMSLKGKKLRLDMAAAGMPGGFFTIMDAASDVTYTVMPAMKQVITTSAAEMAEMRKQMGARMGLPDSAALAAPYTITELGTRGIHGAQAHGYRVVTPTMVSELWVDPALTAIMAAFQGLQQQMSRMSPEGAWQTALREKGFPIQTTGVMKAPAMLGEGWMVTRADVTSVQKGPVADSVFVVPADYTQRKMSDMMPRQ